VDMTDLDGILDRIASGRLRLREALDEISTNLFSRKFSELRPLEQHELVRGLDARTGKWRVAQSNLVSFAAYVGFRMAIDGSIDDLKFFAAMPESARKPLDDAARRICFTEFCHARPEDRRTVLSIWLEVIDEGRSEACREPE
jgi:hypothetical protein